MRTLVSWIGGNDLKATDGGQLGPIASTLSTQFFDQVVFLYNYPKKDVDSYLGWLSGQSKIPFTTHSVDLTSPIDFAEIYQAADQCLKQIATQGETEISILLSPGTPAMQAVWILLGKTKYPVTFYQSSVEQGVHEVQIPFDISAEFLPAVAANRLSKISAAEVPVNAAFDDIHTNNPHMLSLKEQATKMAARDVPVLIYGETGTGKELFARAIHNASPRKGSVFIPVNCGAIPPELIDSTLFGHAKGAFTGAIADRKGVFEAAHEGTLFLDEFGELPLDAQVRLLRVLQSGELTPVGSNLMKKVNVRLICATNRNLVEAVAAGQFREDLFYRIAVGVLHLPPLRERKGDMGLLSDKLLEQINTEAASQPGYKHKKISVKARNLILRHPWHGNIRELHSTLLRATLWAEGEQISEADIQNALFQMPEKGEGVLGRSLEKGFNIQEVIDGVAQHYILSALAETGQNKTRAAEILGLSSYQTLNNWMEKHKVK